MTYEETMQAERTLTVSHREMATIVGLVQKLLREQAQGVGKATAYGKTYDLIVKMRMQVDPCFTATYDAD